MIERLVRLAAFGGILLSFDLPGGAASAAVLCAHEESHLVRLRESACKPRESRVDLSELVTDTSPERWAWLEDTFWYVPEENLKAFLWRTDKPDEDRVLSDQTVWHIERYDSGYIFGPTVINFNNAPNSSCSYLNGSVTPPGKVYIAFTPLVSDESIPAITIGIGEMVNTAAGWTFAMQMATPGPTIPQIVSTEVEHWAFMEQCTRDSDCWANLPGVDGGIDELFSQCDPPANR